MSAACVVDEGSSGNNICCTCQRAQTQDTTEKWRKIARFLWNKEVEKWLKKTERNRDTVRERVAET